jgi:multiple sugar transport system permease protein
MEKGRNVSTAPPSETPVRRSSPPAHVLAGAATGRAKRFGLSDRWIAFLFIAPTIALLLFIAVFPLIWSLYLSFTSYSDTGTLAPQWVGIQNYLSIFADSDIWRYFTITARFVVMSVGLEFLIGFGLALLLNRTFPGRGIIVTLLLTPMMLAPVVVGLFWKFMMDVQFGVLDWFISLTGTCAVRIDCADWLNSYTLAPYSMVIADAWMWTPFMLLISLAGLSAIPRYLYEAAEVDRASAWFKFRRITFPLVWPLLLIALLFRTMDAFKLFDVPYVLTGAGPGDATRTISYDLYDLAFNQFDTGTSCALGYIMLVMVIAIANIYIRYLNRATAAAR